MKDAKKAIILQEGVPVEVKDISLATPIVIETKALLGKATKQFFSEISLEYHRKGQFIPELNINNGMIVSNIVTDEHYLIMANYKEFFQNQHISTITRMIECNSVATIEGIQKTADDFGNIRKGTVIKVKDLQVHVEAVSAELIQYNPGLHEEVEYRIYATAINDINVLDKVILDINGIKKEFKIKSLDFISFRGIVIIGVSSETRK